MVREIFRKIIHIASGTAIIIGGLLIESGLYKQILIGILAIAMLFEFTHSDLKIKLPLYTKLERKHEEKTMHGSMYYMLGITIAFLAFPKEIALAATAMLVYGDGLAAISKDKHSATIMFITSAAAGYFFVPILTATTMAITATIVEKYFKIVNDNLAIPVLAGLIGAIL